MRNEIIAVNATALAHSGALTILKQFISAIDEKINFYYIFVPADIDFENKKNVRYIKIRKQGWVKRILWDSHGMCAMMKKKSIEYDVLLSLQNTSIRTPKKQIIYIHQPLPFTNVNFLKPSSWSFKFFLYQKFYGLFIFLFSDEKTKFIVQTKWMYDALVLRNIDKDCISILPPTLSKKECAETDIPKFPHKIKLLYPATPIVYKNHRVVLKALNILKLNNPSLFSNIVFQVTFDKQQYPGFNRMVEKMNLSTSVDFLGYLSSEKLEHQYKTADLVLFPSYIETFGMPLLESTLYDKKVLCSDLPYAREVLKDYRNVKFVKFDKELEWADAIELYSVKNIDADITSHNNDNYYPDTITWSILTQKL